MSRAAATAQSRQTKRAARAGAEVYSLQRYVDGLAAARHYWLALQYCRHTRETRESFERGIRMLTRDRKMRRLGRSMWGAASPEAAARAFAKLWTVAP